MRATLLAAADSRRGGHARWPHRDARDWRRSPNADDSRRRPPSGPDLGATAGSAGCARDRDNALWLQAPTLAVSARDDGFGPYAPSEYTASQIAGATFLRFGRGGHLPVGHGETVRATILSLLRPTEKP